MDEDRIKNAIEHLKERMTTDQLLQVLKEDDHEKWTEEGFEAIKRVLRESNIDFREFLKANEKIEAEKSEVYVKEVINSDAEFLHMKLKKIKSHSAYRGKGQIVLARDGIKILGKRVYSLNGRILIGAAIFIFSILLTYILFEGKKYFALSIFVILSLLDFVILKKSDTLIPWKNIILVEQNPNKKIIGIDFIGFPNCNPIVFKAKKYDEIISVLNKLIINHE